MCSHGHGGGGGCGGEAAGDDHVREADLGLEWSLWTKVDMDRVECLGEASEGSGRRVLKAWEEREDVSRWVESEADEELLFHIPFAGVVKLKGVRLRGEAGAAQPKTIRLFANAPGMTFDDAQRPPQQSFDASQAQGQELEFLTQPVKFNAVSHLSIHVSANHGADTSKIFYIGLRGDWEAGGRREAVVATYEARPVPKDHKSLLPETGSSNVF